MERSTMSSRISDRIAKVMQAMRADCVPAGACGRWFVAKDAITEAGVAKMEKLAAVGKLELAGIPAPGTHTRLCCLKDFDGSYETVMNDFTPELRKHLGFVLRARGRVLVCGLGLGCVVRGLMANGRVKSVDIVERSLPVVKLCRASVEHHEVALFNFDAFEVPRKLPFMEWDYAWIDLWSDPVLGESNLVKRHAELMALLSDQVGHVGAWNMPRWFSRQVPNWVA